MENGSLRTPRRLATKPEEFKLLSDDFQATFFTNEEGAICANEDRLHAGIFRSTSLFSMAISESSHTGII